MSLIQGEPSRIGDLDGVPAWARDRANRTLLGRALGAGREWDRLVATRVAEQLAAQEAAGRQVQLLTFDAHRGLAAVVLGDMDTADAVGLLVPGIFNTVPGDLPGLLADARGVADAARAAAPGIDVATVAWLGYEPPRTSDPLGALLPFAAWKGGAALDGTLQGLAAAREAVGGPAPRTTVIAHSYGTKVTQEAADRPGRLAADAVVLMGSPGMNWTGSDSLEAPEVYDAWSISDPVSSVGWFGMNTWAPAYGATELPVDWTTTHGAYYDPDRPTLAALGEVVAGTRSAW